MMLISTAERKAILKRFPKARIVSTHHRCFLAARGKDIEGRFLLSLRGMPQPTNRYGESVERI